MKTKFKALSLIGICTVLSGSALAEGIVSKSVDAERKFYIGANIGYSGPLKGKFEDKATQSVFSMKKSLMYTGLIGYKITPDIMMEFTVEHKPTYRLGITLAKEDGGGSGQTKAQSQVYMMNLVYHLDEVKGFQPFFTVGAGLARVRVKEFGVSTAMAGVDAFRTLKHTANCFAWEVGLGVSKPISDNVQINLSGKMQIVHNVKIKYRALDKAATQANITAKNYTMVYNTKEIKKLLGVGEATIGFTYDLPF